MGKNIIRKKNFMKKKIEKKGTKKKKKKEKGNKKKKKKERKTLFKSTVKAVWMNSVVAQ